MSDSRNATAPAVTAAGDGVSVGRRFTEPGANPFDAVEWEIRDAVIGNPEQPAFEQRGVEFPRSWSQNATNIVAQKYFRGQLGSPERERSVKQMISRVAGTIAGWGREGGYFASDEDADAFEAELTHILLHQKAAFNSPVWCKVKEEKKANALRDAGFDMSIDGDGFTSIQYQNANNSVRVSDAFMEAVENDEDWHLIARTTGEPIGEPVKARELMREIAEAAWRCADPGVQYDTTINQWHTCPVSGRINASNPCSEYMHVDDSACNLASLNLMQFVDAQGTFDVAAFRHAVDVAITAQDIVVDKSSYPTQEIGRNSRAFRQLGMGYSNLGAYLMAD